MKRFVNFAVVLFWLVMIGLLIRLDSPGPVIYGQTRIGRNGQPFTFFKFRSMHLDADKEKERLAPRIRIGTIASRLLGKRLRSTAANGQRWKPSWTKRSAARTRFSCSASSPAC